MSDNKTVDGAEVRIPDFLRQSKAAQHSVFVELEWQQRNRLADGLHPSAEPSKWARLQGEEVLARNRYVNVEPFANNRVKLQVAEGINDYINASPIVLGDRRYIATQGPKDSSTAHFYRMLASETSNIAIVVMLTKTHEAGREKCFTYFPLDEDSSPLILSPDADFDDDFEGEVVLESTEDDVKSRSSIRKMKMRIRTTKSKDPVDGDDVGGADTWTEKTVYHLLFGGWPDFLVPEGADRAALLELIALSSRLNAEASAPVSSSFEMYEADGEKEQRSPSELNPRIIHCSAGVGRSGTFIALDYLLDLLDTGGLDNLPPGKDPIADTVDKLRQQRMMMVQGEGQFMFLYETLREAWIKRLKEKQR